MGDRMIDEGRIGPPEFSRNGERKIFDKRKLKIATFESCSVYWVSFKNQNTCKLSCNLQKCKLQNNLHNVSYTDNLQGIFRRKNGKCAR